MQNQLANTFRDLNDIAFFQIVMIVIGAIAIYYLVQKLFPKVADKFAGKWRLYILATVPVIRLLVIVTAIYMIVTRIIQPTTENIFAILGALGIALGFAFKDYVSSLLAGVVALYELPYRPGDWVDIGGTYGEIKSIGVRAMEVVTPDDSVVSIPHLKLWDHLVSNANDGTTHLMCVTDFYLDPDHEPGKVRKILYDTVLTSPFLQLDKPILVLAFEKPWGTHYKVKAYPVDPRDQFQFISDITMRGKNQLLQEGIQSANVAFATS